MGCGKNYDTGSCVADILKDIVDAQNDIVENCCDTSCDQSINDLLGENDTSNGLDTVPVILYCKDCKPFKGFGAVREHRSKIGDILSSFIFRVKKVDKDNCAVLELLLSDGESCGYDHLKDPTEQSTHDLEATGICITVDLDCFCHVTCLPAINAFN
ncbi:CotY/CotZ family spore coat protein [Oceanobacillus iheyensis]|uniref:Spore coat protein (Insoluble fraction) n=1 Tax=Oceanobacillus iheyensis (strain DSM 14371 / CIP 107618 / JCM 11309 / KCTC 3954 / HTE831) TaxID=221109 RepID=Q8CXJ9_OCEIH|nr:CotY/CotZ family spore coat protein [Oceanobacillus iheyensis]BAC13182.1 spore coat protein (insoluble fraction) [Oceanobacillus iheyensis HTE831]